MKRIPCVFVGMYTALSLSYHQAFTRSIRNTRKMTTKILLEPRRSLRLQSLSAKNGFESNPSNTNTSLPDSTKVRKRKIVTEIVLNTESVKEIKSVTKNKVSTKNFSLPRTIENQLKEENSLLKYVIGIDEAGRGPLAGPVVAAAVIVPPGIENHIHGIIDSKKITLESMREELYEKIIANDAIHWSVAIIDSNKIDEINILQATLLGMEMAASGLVGMNKKDQQIIQHDNFSANHAGCYIVCGQKGVKHNLSHKDGASLKSNIHFALIDGNKIPKNMPCESQSIVKGDGKEYVIAVASIIAKVTRDRLMHEYHTQYPHYNLCQHKGYPTSSHMAAVHEFGASPIHRRSFAPLKHMIFDKEGRKIGMKVDQEKNKK